MKTHKTTVRLKIAVQKMRYVTFIKDNDHVLFDNGGQPQEEICVFICTGEVKISTFMKTTFSCFTILVNSKGEIPGFICTGTGEMKIPYLHEDDDFVLLDNLAQFLRNVPGLGGGAELTTTEAHRP
jgi:hypothetical protein